MATDLPLPEKCIYLDLRVWFTPERITQIMAVAAEQAKRVVVTGASTGGLEDAATAGLDYYVMDGTKIREHLPWLSELQESSEIRELIKTQTGRTVLPRDNPTHDTNINVVTGAGKRYEWHTDTYHWTLLVFITSHDEPTAGGALCMNTREAVATQTLEQAYASSTKVAPEAGYGVLFNGSEIPHAVQPLKTNVVRITVPMAYMEVDAPRLAHPDADYLFGTSLGTSL